MQAPTHIGHVAARGLVEGGDAGRELLAEFAEAVEDAGALTVTAPARALDLAHPNSRWTLDAAIDRPVIPGALARPPRERRNFHGCLKPNHGVGVGVGDLQRLEDPNSISLAGR